MECDDVWRWEGEDHRLWELECQGRDSNLGHSHFQISYPGVADGKGFFTRDMGFENTAGIEGQPASALCSTAPSSATAPSTATKTLSTPTYLGRPWKDYPTIVVMQTKIGGFVHPAGWMTWAGDETDPPNTIFYIC
ncbi:pectinesterase 3 [Cinnamomum micranthum f. kanehirae]|uniref:Pectinesterase 3 n=1 Tax=Cinnamomum micranthum f. kanehirae TaxID=337451 RepID=A0A3S3N4K7_9MAGN|nr:pectinesterase 3 [Cinnamomum micranthum f. kanehirae]